MNMKKGDPFVTPSFASINITPDCRLFMALASLLNDKMYSLNSSSSPCQISFKSTPVFGLSLLVVKENLNVPLKSSHKSMDLDKKDLNYFNEMDFNDSGNARHKV